MTDQISTNPKKACGAVKVPLHLVPPALAIGAAHALGEGAPRYGPYNWRDAPVDASTYIGAIERHMCAYKDGEDIDPESTVGKTHLEGIAACCAILLDSIAMGILIDDRKKGPGAQLVRALSLPKPAALAQPAEPVDPTPLSMAQTYDLPDRAPIEVMWSGSNVWIQGCKTHDDDGALFEADGLVFELRRVTAAGVTGTKVRRRAA